MDLTDSRIASAIQNSPDWRAATADVLALFAQERRCYSSGEIATALRLHRPDLRFEVPKLGVYVKDQFYSQALPLYTEQDGTTTPPVQVSRFTVGKFRTPANTEVFVYGPDATSCNVHEFEVYVPKPRIQQQDGTFPAVEPTPTPNVPDTNAATGPGTPQHTAAIAILGAQPAVKEIRATVWPDARLCIPRNALEYACHLGSTPIVQGQPVFVTVEPGVKAIVNLNDPGNGVAKPYSVTKDQGRVAFGSPDPASPFPIGKNFIVSVAAGEITVDLTNPL